MSIGEILANTLSPEQRVREDATNKLEELKAVDFGAYAQMLCQELAAGTSTQNIRQAAGLALKNTLLARELARRDEYASRWMSLAPDARAQIKQLVLHTLRTSDIRTAGTTAQVIAAIASVELPRGDWKELITTLLENMQETAAPTVRQATLQAIGFVCEEMEASDVLEAQSDVILTAIVAGARKEEPSPEVRLAAMNALYNSLEFVRKNFEREGERNYIMQVVCEATQSEQTEIQLVAFECLVRIMQLYYDKMSLYMQKALFGLTIVGMRHDDEKVKQQAIEFWSTVCEEELEILYDHYEMYGDENGAPDAATAAANGVRELFHFAKMGMPEVVPVLLWLLTLKDEDDDEDDWNVSMAASACLALFAQVVGDAIVPQVLPFVEQNIRSTDWRYREAAVLAFGSIVEGPMPSVLGPLVSQAFPVLLEMMKDSNALVRDATAWTLGRVCKELPDQINFVVYLGPLIHVLLAGLEQKYRIGSSCCWALANLAEHFGTQKDSTSSPLSPFFEGIIDALVTAADREVTDLNQSIRAPAYEAIAKFTEGATADCFGTIETLTRGVLGKIEAGLNAHHSLVGMDEKSAFYETQGLLCSILGAVVRRLGPAIGVYADQIMGALLQVMQQYKASTVTEDAMLAIGTVATAIESGFVRYQDAVLPVLVDVLRHPEDIQLCSIGLGVLGDLFRTVTQNILPHCETIMGLLFELLQNPALDRSLKPLILNDFGEFALAIGPHFEPFLSHIMTFVFQAASTQVDTLVPELMEYQFSLRESVIEALSGIVMAFKGTPKAPLLMPYTETMFEFLHALHKEGPQARSPEITRGMIGLLGDLGESFPNGELRRFYGDPWVDQFFKEVKQDKHAPGATRELVRWAREIIRRQMS